MHYSSRSLLHHKVIMPSYYHFQPCHSFRSSTLYATSNESKSNRSQPKLDFNEDFYNVLEVSRTVTPEELKKAYYKLVFRYHPDNKRTDEEKVLCNKQMMVINNAYKILKNKSLREQYDIKKKTGFYRASDTSPVKDESPTPTPTTKTKVADNYSKNSPNNAKSNSNFKSNESWEEAFRSYTENADDNKKTSNYNDIYNNIDFNFNNINTDEKVESFGDILQDIFTDVTFDGGKNFMRDLFEYLENNIPTGGSGASFNYDYSNSGSGGSSSHINEVKLRLENEIDLLKNTMTSLETHIQKLLKERSQLSSQGTVSSILSSTFNSPSPSTSASSTTTSNRFNSSPTVTVTELEERLRLLETARGLDARIFESKKQLRQVENTLKEKTKQLQSLNNRNASTTSTTSSDTKNSNSYENSNNSYSNNRVKTGNAVDDDMAYSSSYYKQDSPPASPTPTTTPNNSESSSSSSRTYQQQSQQAQNVKVASQQTVSNNMSNKPNINNYNTGSSRDRDAIVEDELKKLKIKISKEQKSK